MEKERAKGTGVATTMADEQLNWEIGKVAWHADDATKEKATA